jgi:hypothetical protein
METRDAKGIEVDIGSFLGYEVIKVMLKWRHSNEDYNWFTGILLGVQSAGMKPVNDFIFELELSENAFPEDFLVLVGPPSFMLQQDPNCNQTQCACIASEFLMPQRITNPEILEEAYCKGETLTLPLKRLDTALQARQLIRWMLKLVNAEVPPPEGTNYWTIRHLNPFGNTVASAITDSWTIVPTITNVFSEITGTKRAAGALTTLTFTFHNLLEASELELTALQPDGFDFDECFIHGTIAGIYTPYLQIIQPIVLKEALRKSYMVRFVASLKARQNNTVNFENVHLPFVSNRSKWTLRTFALSTAKEDYGTPYIRDAVEFFGFGVPGRIMVHDVRASTFVTTLRGVQLFMSAVLGGGKSNVTVEFDVGSDLFANDIVLMAFKATDMKNEPKLVEDGFRVDGVAKMKKNATGSPVRPAKLKADFNEARAVAFNIGADVAQGTRITFTLPTKTPKDREVLSYEGLLVEVYRGGYSPEDLIATNDESRVSLPVVTLYDFPPPAIEHVPPLTTTQAAFQIDPKDTEVMYMIITAPPGFNFSADCMAPGELNENLTLTGGRCFRLQPHESIPVPEGSRARARLDCNANGGGPGIECLVGEVITVMITTPDKTPDALSNIWDVEAINYLGEDLKVFGRAELSGFSLVPMEATVAYAALASVPIDVGISFRSRVDIPAGGSVVVSAPGVLSLFACSSDVRGVVSPLSLGAITGCKEGDERWSITLGLNSTLMAGLHSLSVPGKSSLLKPELADNLFHVYLQNADGENLDVALNIPGETVMYGLRSNVWGARFRMGKDNTEPIKVFIPIEVLDTADVTVNGMLISAPQAPSFKIRSGSVTISSYYGSDTKLKEVVVAEDGTSAYLELESMNLEQDVYQVSMEVDYPSALPQYNIWRLALCNGTFPNATNNGCELQSANFSIDARGEAVLTVFAVAGFDPFNAQYNLPPPMVGGEDHVVQPHRSLLLPLMLTSVVLGTMVKRM